MTQAHFRKWGPESIEITLGGQLLECERGRLGVHLELGEILDLYQEEVKARSSGGVRRALTSYLGVGTKLNSKAVESLSFVEAGEAFLRLQSFNQLRFFPPFLSGEDEPRPDREALPWDYKGRDLHIWIHTLASTYGWSREEILGLVPEEAVIYIQEIMLDDQFKREWEYGLSGQGHIYNQRTRTSHFRPLIRPSWMVRKEPTVVKMPKSLMPVGNVVYGGGLEPKVIHEEGGSEA